MCDVMIRTLKKACVHASFCKMSLVRLFMPLHTSAPAVNSWLCRVLGLLLVGVPIATLLGGIIFAYVR
jgi:hypothetical protein